MKLEKRQKIGQIELLKKRVDHYNTHLWEYRCECGRVESDTESHLERHVKHKKYMCSECKDRRIRDNAKRCRDKQKRMRQDKPQKKRRGRHEKERVETRTGFVYLIHCVGSTYYKIGYSEVPENRIVTMRTACPYEIELLHVIKAGWNTEKYLHEMYESCRARGEWFSFRDDEIEDVIEAMNRAERR